MVGNRDDALHFSQMGKVPSSMTQFFIAELVLVLEYLHRKSRCCIILMGLAGIPTCSHL